MLKEYITEKNVVINSTAKDKKELLMEMIKIAKDSHCITSEDNMLTAIEEKEKLHVMEVAPHIVLPHARGEFVKKLFVIMAISKKGMPYKGLKKNTANIAILIGIPKEDHDYLKLLAGISRLMTKDEFVKGLIDSDVKADVTYVIKKFSAQVERADVSKKKYFVILTLNKNEESAKISPLLTEVGLDLVTEIEGKNLGNAFMFIPFLAAFGFSSGISKYNKTYMGLTDEKEASSKLFALLKADNIDLNQDGVGSLFQIEVMQSYGGFSEDVDF